MQGKREYIEELRAWQDVIGRGETVPANLPLTENLRMVQARVAEGSPLIQNPVNRQDLQLKTRGMAIALRRGNRVRRSGLSRQPLRAGDHVLLQGRVETADLARRMEEFDEVIELEQETLERLYRPNERLISVRVPAGSPLVGLAYGESRLAEALEFRLLTINREDEVNFIPDPDEVLREDDRLLLQTRNEDLETLRAVQELEIEEEMTPALNLYATDRLATEEVTLAPLSRLGGRTAAEIGFNEKHGLELVAIRRAGQTLHTDLQTEQLNFGDALLLVGPRNNLRRLARDPAFIEVTPFVPRRPRKRYAGLIMIGVIGAVLTGWLPISIAALIGATLMVLIRCLNMEDAYRAIDWRAVFPHRGHAASGHGAGQHRRRPAAGRHCGRSAGDAGTVVRDRRALPGYGAGHDDRPHRRAGGADVARGAVGQRLARDRAHDGDDGHGHGGVGQLHQPDIPSGQYPHHGTRKLPVQGLHPGGHSAYAARVRDRDAAAADILAAAAGSYAVVAAPGESVLIVGGGQAAAQLAVSLRLGGHGGPITLVSDENALPYQRPPLSKQYLAGELERERLLLRRAEYYESRDVELRLGRRVLSVDRGSRLALLDNGEELGYDRLVLATGSVLRKLDVPGSELPGIHYLRSLDDADTLQEELAPGRRIVIVGGGYIGLEVAATAAKAGAEVTVLEAEERVMSRVASAAVADWLTGLHRQSGRVHSGRGAGPGFRGAPPRPDGRNGQWPVYRRRRRGGHRRAPVGGPCARVRSRRRRRHPDR